MSFFRGRVAAVVVAAIVTVATLQPLAPSVARAATKPQAIADQSTLVVKVKPGKDVNELSGFAPQLKGRNIKPLLKVDKQTHQKNRTLLAEQLPAGHGDLENYYTIKLSVDQKADDVASYLKARGLVAAAYAKPLPAPAPVTPNYANLQKYIKSAPVGMGTKTTIGGSGIPYPGSTGSQVRVADLEYSWNTQHEDLSRLRLAGALWPNGTPADPFGDTNHGTAVAGIISARNNGSGVDGIVPYVSYHMVNTYNNELGWDVTNAIYVAANKMSKGDVIVIQQQAWAPDSLGYAPIEVYQDVYDAIVYAVAKGVHVVEPAGNGKFDYTSGYNLSDPLFGGIFTTARPNSGAIMVGAGGAGCGVPALARMPYSNYGARVDVQGHGECVVTTGYGDLYNAGLNTQYTSGFSGTSSASAMVAAVAAELASSYEQVNAASMTTVSLKKALKAGGSLQNPQLNPGNIGVLPNMASALKWTDFKKPTTPTGLVGASNGLNNTALSWNAATDNLGYIRYQVYRNGTKIATTSAASYNDKSTRPQANFTYYVVAVDASNNVSAASNSVVVFNR